jgi:hypothetical protein
VTLRRCKENNSCSHLGSFNDAISAVWVILRRLRGSEINNTTDSGEEP